MQDMELKNKVLEEIMALMDEKEGEKLKSHPKLMAAKVEVEKPEVVAELSPVVAEEKEMQSGEESEDELDPEMIKQLLAKLEQEQ